MGRALLWLLLPAGCIGGVQDQDLDGILDADDLCPSEGEDDDIFDDADGCPEPDNDEDRIVDADDECPNDAETYDLIDDADGCPDGGTRARPARPAI